MKTFARAPLKGANGQPKHRPAVPAAALQPTQVTSCALAPPNDHCSGLSAVQMLGAHVLRQLTSSAWSCRSQGTQPVAPAGGGCWCRCCCCCSRPGPLPLPTFGPAAPTAPSPASSAPPCSPPGPCPWQTAGGVEAGAAAHCRLQSRRCRRARPGPAPSPPRAAGSRPGAPRRALQVDRRLH